MRVRAGRSRCWAVLGLLMMTEACGDQVTPVDVSPEVSSPATQSVLFDFDDDLTARAGRVANVGRLGGSARVETAGGGTVSFTTGPDGGRALRLPSYSDADPPRRAVLVYRDPIGDGLDPGSDEFTFGAEFMLDPVAEDLDGDDDGNNLVQRGLSADQSQYKLQVEHDRASCRVAGDLGAVLVKSGERVKTGQWYHLACSRRGSRVALILTELGDHDPDRVSATGAIGSLACPARTPLVVGGKAAADGTVIRRESDQFNGVVDNVFFETG